jgi:hypothetical protein
MAGSPLIALELSSLEVFFAVGMALLLAVLLWGPYLYEEIVRGKASEGPRFPDGAGDTHPGRRGDPAPGHRDGQSDPYETWTQR